MGWNYLSIPKLQHCNSWSLGIDMWIHPTFYWTCDYLSMQGLKLPYVSKKVPCCFYDCEHIAPRAHHHLSGSIRRDHPPHLVQRITMDLEVSVVVHSLACMARDHFPYVCHTTVAAESGLILGLRPAIERRRYSVTPPLIGWVQT